VYKILDLINKQFNWEERREKCVNRQERREEQWRRNGCLGTNERGENHLDKGHEQHQRQDET